MAKAATKYDVIYALTSLPTNYLSLLTKARSVCDPLLSFHTCRRKKCEILLTSSTMRKSFRLTPKP